MVSEAGGGEWEVEFAEDKAGSNPVWSSHGLNAKMIDAINTYYISNLLSPLQVKLTLKTEDLIPAASLKAGHRVTHFGFSKGERWHHN